MPVRNCLLGVIACAILLGLAAAAQAAEVASAPVLRELHVSPAGNDGNPGTAQEPLQSFAAAQIKLRLMKAAAPGPFCVWLHEGVYYLPKTIVLTAEDSGTAAATVTYTAAPGERAVLSGGMRLNLKWEPYRNGIMKAAVPAGFATDQLFVNGARQTLARYPNYDPKARYFNGSAADAVTPQRAMRWADPRGGLIHAMHEALWGSLHYRITAKDADQRLTYEGGWQTNRPSPMHAEIRFVENIFEELDAPGEWFHDAKNNLLCFLPPPGLDLGKATVEAVRLRHLIEVRGDAKQPVRFVCFRGLSLQHAARTVMETREPLLLSDWTIYRGGALFLSGAEDCILEDCQFDQLGGNAVFFSNYNRRCVVRGCHIREAGASGVAFVGDPNAVRNAVSGPWKTQTFQETDKTAGPASDNYPSHCLVEDCLIHRIGCTEKQTAGVQIAMAEAITVRHCSIYDVPRAGVNIGDGCWGGHVVEFCDVFDTVRETGDHGSFNSWGRDRFWRLSDVGRDTMTQGEHRNLPLLDAAKPTILRNNRWRCDLGWDIDLDDGSSNYEIYNNLCLNGGIKNREGYYRVVENNITVGNSFHPHVWFQASEDVFRRNIVFTPYKPIDVKKPWGKAVDNNLLHTPGQTKAAPAGELQAQSGRDEHSLAADALFVDARHGDYRVKEDSPARKLGFQNFPMDQFGVQRPTLRALARTPQLPGAERPETVSTAGSRNDSTMAWLGATVKNIVGMGEVSAASLPRETGVKIVELAPQSRAACAGLETGDVILQCDGQPTDTVADLLKTVEVRATKGSVKLEVWRKQKSLWLELTLPDASR